MEEILLRHKSPTHAFYGAFFPFSLVGERMDALLAGACEVVEVWDSPRRSWSPILDLVSP